MTYVVIHPVIINIYQPQTCTGIARMQYTNMASIATEQFRHMHYPFNFWRFDINSLQFQKFRLTIILLYIMCFFFFLLIFYTFISTIYRFSDFIRLYICCKYQSFKSNYTANIYRMSLYTMFIAVFTFDSANRFCLEVQTKGLHIVVHVKNI